MLANGQTLQTKFDADGVKVYVATDRQDWKFGDFYSEPVALWWLELVAYVRDLRCAARNGGTPVYGIQRKY